MGTPAFAVGVLEAIVSAGYEVIGVVTAMDKPAGRGMKLQYSAVKMYALEKGIPVLQPKSLKDVGFLQELENLEADVFVVVAFRMLPEQVFAMPPKGCFNLHASLLPAYRGAAPINWAIINGEMVTGVTTFFLAKEIDTGQVILQKKVDIPWDFSAGDLHDELMIHGADLVVESLRMIENNNCVPVPQPMVGDFPKAPKIFSADCEIDWNKTALSLYHFIRGLSPYPAAYTVHNGKRVKIFKTALLRHQEADAGQWTTDGKTWLHIATSQGALDILELQEEGKKRMGIEAYLRGHKME